jgi:hypothetical protein
MVLVNPRRRSESLILWTIQHVDAWRKAERSGVLRNDARRAWHSFRQAYRWMAAEMSDRVSRPPRNVRHPVWAWFQYENERQRRPDLGSGGHLPAGTSGVLIEFSVPDRDVLLSDFDLWHYVLNRWYIPSTLRDWARIEKLSYDDLPSGREMEESWIRIFDLEWSLKDVAEPLSKKSIQAAVWEVPLASVRSVRFFRARGRILPSKSIGL